MWKRAESTNKPLEVDTSISEGLVYIRKNIISVIKNEVEMFEYDEAILTNEEYKTYLLLNNLSSNISFKHETDIIDDYTLLLIEEGTL